MQLRLGGVGLHFFLSVISCWVTDFTNFKLVRLVGGRSGSTIDQVVWNVYPAAFFVATPRAEQGLYLPTIQ